MTPEQRAGIEARHRVKDGEDDYRADGTDARHIDCDAAMLLAALAEAEQEVREVHEQASAWFRQAQEAEQREAALVKMVERLAQERDAAQKREYSLFLDYTKAADERDAARGPRP